MSGPQGPILKEWDAWRPQEPVIAPPSFSHSAGARPQQKPFHSPEMRRANNRLSNNTLSQLATAGGLTPESFPDDPMERHSEEESSTTGHSDPRSQAVHPQYANPVGINANFNGSREALNNNSLVRLRDSHLRSRLRTAFLSNDLRSPLPGPVGPPPNFRPGPPPMMSPRGPPPDGRAYPPQRDPRLGPPPPCRPVSPEGAAARTQANSTAGYAATATSAGSRWRLAPDQQEATASTHR